MTQFRAPLRERLERRLVTSPSGCWEWTGSRNENGYGQISLGPGPIVKAHRAAWMVYRGPIPDGIQVLHHCDNPPCCNPDHLYLGTPADNSRDRISRGRHRSAPLKGSAHPLAKLTEADVRHIRDLGRPYGLHALARLYGINRTTITAIVDRRKWKHVP